MRKKIICCCLLILFVLPLPAMASFSSDVAQFKQKYSAIYNSIDPAISAKMDLFLQDVVNYVVTNHDSSKDIDVQITNAVGSVLLTGDTYKNDLLPFMLDQAANKEVYRSQLSEMKAIVRTEVQVRLNSTTPVSPGGGAAPNNSNTANATTTEVSRQLAAGNTVISLTPEDGANAVELTGTVLGAITTAGKQLEIKASGVTFRLPPAALVVPDTSIVSLSVQTLGTTKTTEAEQKLSSDQKLVGPIYEFSATTGSSSGETQFQKAVTVVLSYAEADIANISEDTLNAFYLNETTGKWTNMNGTIDKAKNTITFTTSHFSKYAILGAEPAPKPELPPVVVPSAGQFTDISGHWAQANIVKLVSTQAINGYPDSTFRPDNTITRAEFATILVKAFKLSPKSGKVFADTAGHWAKDYIATANAYGIINGYSDSTFAPNDRITREQMAVMTVKAAGLKKTGAGKIFADASHISNWAKESVDIASQYALISGYPDNTYRPAGTASRAEAVTVIIKALNK